MLFLTPDNELAGDRQNITLEEIRATTHSELYPIEFKV